MILSKYKIIFLAICKKPGVIDPGKILILFFFNKFFFADSANWADPIFWQIFKGRAGGDSVVRIANFWVVNVSAGFAFVF